MAPNPRLQDARLAALYARVPEVECKGLCQESCTAVGMSTRERARAEAELGAPVTCAPDGICSALDENGHCGVYEARPMVCRLWGATEDMPCPHGCRPRGGGPLLTSEEARELQHATAPAGGGYDSEQRVLAEMDLLVRALERDPERLARVMQRAGQ